MVLALLLHDLLLVPLTVHVATGFLVLTNVSQPVDFRKDMFMKRASAQTACRAYQRLRTGVSSYRAQNEQLLICKLLNDYEPTIRPYVYANAETRAIQVNVSLELSSISTVSVANMEFVAQFRFQQQWYDSRLRFSGDQYYFRVQPFVNLSPDQLIWRPDTFFQNEKNGWDHDVTQVNRLTRVRFDGFVTYNRRLTLTCSCIMKLKRYPLDTQRCEIEFASYAYTVHDIHYVWNRPALKVSKHVGDVLPNFRIRHVQTGICSSNTTTGVYSCLKVYFVLEREFSYFALQIYCPCVMLVSVSWVSYWIDWQTPAARAPLTIVTLLTMITTQQSISKSLPPVSYTKAIDIWTGGCVLFIFAALIEYAIVNFVGMTEMKRLARRHRIAEEVKKMGPLVRASAERQQYQQQQQQQQQEQQDSRRQKYISGDTYHDPLREQLRTARHRRAGLLASPDVESDSQSLAGGYGDGRPFDTWRFVARRRVLRVRFARAWQRLECMLLCERIDVFARVLHPVLFGLFNVAYWLVYVCFDDDQPHLSNTDLPGEGEQTP